ncbi:MAG: hypothetical protein QOH26_2074 [Actinomycetota bacterium]|nr:hypothetical protein [Actinomycetota bacterium]
MTKGPEADVDARRASFLAVGDDYERTRPQYPVRAIEWVIGQEKKTILDLGCGPGKLTAQLVHLGHRAFGMDPSLAMLRGMKAKKLLAVCGRAEEIPVTAGAVDVVTAAQAFHWFDHDTAIPEMRRILKDDGRIGLFWNLRDESVDWIRRLSDIIGSEDATRATLGEPGDFSVDVGSKLAAGGSFQNVEVMAFPYEQRLTLDGLVGLVRSRSYVAVLPEDEREKLLREVRSLHRDHQELRGRKTFNLLYKTIAFRAQAA